MRAVLASEIDTFGSKRPNKNSASQRRHIQLFQYEPLTLKTEKMRALNVKMGKKLFFPHYSQPEESFFKWN